MNEFSISEVNSFENLLEIINKNQIEYNLDLIKQAYHYAEKMHFGQKRKSGDDYTVHCLTVAAYIARLRLDTVSICAALIHDTVEKADADIDEIDHLFGTEIAFIVEGLTKIRNFSKKIDHESKQQEFTNLIFNSSEDIRIVMIRLAEKLHNLTTINQMDVDSQNNTAKKALYMYAPLAEYLGLGVIQKYLEDYSFKILHPKEYTQLDELVDNYFFSNKNLILDFESELSDLLSEYKVKPKSIESRKKGLYSAYKKLKNKYKYQEKGLNIVDVAKQNLKDIYAARIIVDTVEECYVVLGLIQANFETLQDEFSDYIAHPKDNGYKSIHVLFKFAGIILEVQIRTIEMHEYNEFGPASHIIYKMQRESRTASNQPITWTKDLVNWKSNESNKKDNFKVAAFQNSIFCFTPKGLVISLPKDASPIDFAYRVHTDIGDKYRGALVNGKMVSMDYKLKTGDVVEIIMDKEINVRRDWLKFAKSTSVRARIRRRLRAK